MGKNKLIGEELATYLKSTINPAELENVNYSLKGITANSFDPILSCLQESGDLEIKTLRSEPACVQVTLKSISHQDLIGLNFEGLVLFDLLAVNGLASNRFASIKFRNNSFDRSSFVVETDINPSIKNEQDAMAKHDLTFLIGSVLSSNELEKFLH
jgi:hypothetical protein